MNGWIHEHELQFAFMDLVVLWVVVSALVGQLTGWASLARRFRFRGQFAGPTWHWQSGRMRWLMGYNSSLIVGANTDGLYLATLWLFRIGHPPLLIPWNEISVSGAKLLWARGVRLQLGRERPVPLWLRDKLADKLRAAAGAVWPAETPVM